MTSSEKRKAYKKSYLEKHGDKARAYCREYYKQHRASILKQKQEYNSNNASHKKSYMEQYRIDNPGRVGKHNILKNCKIALGRLKKSIEKSKLPKPPKALPTLRYRTATRLRVRFNSALKRGYKAGSVVSDLGCTLDEFKIYIESLWLPGMS